MTPPLTCKKYDKRLSVWKGTAVYCHRPAVYGVRVVGHPNLRDDYARPACRRHLAATVKSALLDTPGTVLVELVGATENNPSTPEKL